MLRDIEFNANNYEENTTKDWIDIFGANARILCVAKNIGGDFDGPVLIKEVTEFGFSDGHNVWDTVAPIFIDKDNKPVMLLSKKTIEEYRALWEPKYIFEYAEYNK